MIKLKDLIKEFLKSDLQKGSDVKRKKRGKRIKVEYRNTNKRTKTSIFKVTDPGGSGKSHEVRVRFPDYSQISRQRKNITREEKIGMALEAGDLKVFCSCPDFLYKGFKYMATEMEYGIRKETRPPNITNKNREGTACKHTLGVLNQITKFMTKISGDMKW
jgi:hypothetical protein